MAPKKANGMLMSVSDSLLVVSDVCMQTLSSPPQRNDRIINQQCLDKTSPRPAMKQRMGRPTHDIALWRDSLCGGQLGQAEMDVGQCPWNGRMDTRGDVATEY